MKWVPSFVARRSKAHEFDMAGVVVDANHTDFKEGDEIIATNPVGESRFSPLTPFFAQVVLMTVPVIPSLHYTPDGAPTMRI